METQSDILKKSISFAINSTNDQKSLMYEYFERIRHLNVNQLTNEEKNFIKNIDLLDTNLPLINMFDAIKFGGFKNGWPNLAIATYEMSLKNKPLFAKIYTIFGDLVFSTHENYGTKGKEMIFRANIYSKNENRDDCLVAKTPVPLVPPELRQVSSEDVYILFEVNKWNSVPLPIDPYLLKKIHGNIFAIIGTWDLTQKELDTYRAIHF